MRSSWIALPATHRFLGDHGTCLGWYRRRPYPGRLSERLLNWKRAPFARPVHPQEDHLIPLHVAVGAAEAEPAEVIYHEENFSGMITMSSYRFGERGVDSREA